MVYLKLIFKLKMKQSTKDSKDNYNLHIDLEDFYF